MVRSVSDRGCAVKTGQEPLGTGLKRGVTGPVGGLRMLEPSAPRVLASYRSSENHLCFG
jgi:hypothetical protein